MTYALSEKSEVALSQQWCCAHPLPRKLPEASPSGMGHRQKEFQMFAASTCGSVFVSRIFWSPCGLFLMSLVVGVMFSLSSDASCGCLFCHLFVLQCAAGRGGNVAVSSPALLDLSLLHVTASYTGRLSVSQWRKQTWWLEDLLVAWGPVPVSLLSLPPGVRGFPKQVPCPG